MWRVQGGHVLLRVPRRGQQGEKLNEIIPHHTHLLQMRQPRVPGERQNYYDVPRKADHTGPERFRPRILWDESPAFLTR